MWLGFLVCYPSSFLNFQAEHSEKPSIVALINLVADKIAKKHDAVALTLDVSISILYVTNKCFLRPRWHGPTTFSNVMEGSVHCNSHHLQFFLRTSLTWMNNFLKRYRLICWLLFVYLSHKVSTAAFDSAMSVLNAVQSLYLPSSYPKSVLPSEDEISVGETTLAERNQTSLQ